MSELSVSRHARTENLTGREFGILKVESFAGYSPKARWNCRCKCGRTKAIGAYDLKRGHIVSCGCGTQFIKEDAVERQPEWHCYSTMLSRCHNPNDVQYFRYGGRGVSVCDRWRQGFRHFLADVGRRPSPSHTLDRYPDNNGNYEPGNVRWATKKQQSRNTRTNRLITFRGETRTLAEWAEVVGINYQTLKSRVNRCKWSVERALTTRVPA